MIEPTDADIGRAVAYYGPYTKDGEVWFCQLGSKSQGLHPWPSAKNVWVTPRNGHEEFHTKPENLDWAD